MNPHARDHPRSAEIEIHTHHATHTHTRTHKSCPRLPRRRPPPTPLARRAAQRRSCLSPWGGRRCAAPPSYTVALPECADSGLGRRDGKSRGGPSARHVDVRSRGHRVRFRVIAIHVCGSARSQDKTIGPEKVDSDYTELTDPVKSSSRLITKRDTDTLAPTDG